MHADTPYELFAAAFDAAVAAGIPEPNAMVVATVGPDGQPSARVVLLKAFDRDGFVFYTNLTSRKGNELHGNPRAAICFFWQKIGKQVRIEGSVEPVTDAEADEYFASRPRGSQIGAWASLQSHHLDNREELLARVEELETMYEGREVPRPPHWSGFRLRPHRFEFWTAGEFRLHDRRVFEADPVEGWRTELLFP